jgi:hypothetical protein
LAIKGATKENDTCIDPSHGQQYLGHQFRSLAVLEVEVGFLKIHMDRPDDHNAVVFISTRSLKPGNPPSKVAHVGLGHLISMIASRHLI